MYSVLGTLQVDAALDLSHTQNIGRMIKEHFPHSQVRSFQAMGHPPVGLFFGSFQYPITVIAAAMNNVLRIVSIVQKTYSVDLLPCSVYRGVIKGGHVQQRKCHLPDQIC